MLAKQVQKDSDDPIINFRKESMANFSPENLKQSTNNQLLAKIGFLLAPLLPVDQENKLFKFSFGNLTSAVLETYCPQNRKSFERIKESISSLLGA